MGGRATDGRTWRAGRKFRLSTPFTKAIEGGRRSRRSRGVPFWWRFFRHAILREGERERCVANDTSIIYATNFNLSSSIHFRAA